MDDGVDERGLDGIPKVELISRYINDYEKMDGGRRLAFEGQFRKRRMPIPTMSPKLPCPEATRPRKREADPMDRSTFLSYVLLIYTGTAIFYSWIYVFIRLAKGDLDRRSRHKIIQTGIALFYIIAEVLLVMILFH
jgi:hypothetical protein